MVDLSSVQNYFLSHAGADKDFVKAVATRIRFAGRDCFLDEWSIGVGESIPGAIAEAIRSFDVLVLFWSSAAESSAWVRREFQASLTRFIEDESRSFVVVRLDDTDIPELVRDLRWIDAAGRDANKVANALLGLSDGDRLKAMQSYLDSMEIRVEYFPGFGAMVACPRCGRTADNLDCKVRWEMDDELSYLSCKACGWQDASEL